MIDCGRWHSLNIIKSLYFTSILSTDPALWNLKKVESQKYYTTDHILKYCWVQSQSYYRTTNYQKFQITLRTFTCLILFGIITWKFDNRTLVRLSGHKLNVGLHVQYLSVFMYCLMYYDPNTRIKVRYSAHLITVPLVW